MAQEVEPDELIPDRMYRVESRDYSTFIGKFLMPEYLFFDVGRQKLSAIVRMSTFFDSDGHEILPYKLVPGKTYKVVNSDGEEQVETLEGPHEPFTGKFIAPDFHFFNNVIDDSESVLRRSIGRRRDPIYPVPAKVSETSFFEAADSIVRNQAYRGLANRLPENVVGRIKEILDPNSVSGPQRFPLRPVTKKRRLNNLGGGKTRRSRRVVF